MPRENAFDPGPPVVNVATLIGRSCRWHAQHTALRSARRTLTYAELEQRSNRLAHALLARGLQRGARVGIYLPNCTEIVELELACYKAALVKAAFNARLAPMELAAALDNSDADMLVTSAERFEALRPHLHGKPPALLLLDGAPGDGSNYEAALAAASDHFTPAPVRANELAVLHYTSGSSGVLKAAMQTFGNRLAQLRKFLMRAEPMQPGHMLGLVGPITHASGMHLAPALCCGAGIHIFERFAPQDFLADMRRLRITHTFMVPTMINMLLEQAAAQKSGEKLLPDLLRLGYGGAPMAPARIAQAMDAFGPVLSQGYGAGETTSGVCTLSVQDHIYARASRPELLAACGRPLLECAVDIVAEDGSSLPPGEVGEIVVGGADVFAGYWRAPDLTAEVLKNGRYHSGDLARMDEAGYIYIVDRKKDMVISGGFNVYPNEVEAVLYRHPAVLDACVFAMPDDTWGEAVAAHIVARAGHAPTAAALQDFCGAHLAGFKRPRHIAFVENLPKNPNGKIVRRLVQQPYWQGQQRKVN